MTVCQAFPVGLDTDVGGNTLGCRAYHAGAAPTNTSLHCPHAGPSGGGVCGSICEAYCNLTKFGCNGTNTLYPSHDSCMAVCAKMYQNGSIGDLSGNTVQCRVSHAAQAAASYASANSRCSYASVHGNNVCGAPTNNYCDLSMQMCGTSQFANTDACKTYAIQYPAGMWNDTSGNTLGCRIYHTMASVALNDAVHCKHGAPSGENVCGTWCDVYCQLALAACTGSNKLFNALSDCTTACNQYNSSGLSGATGGDTVQCRIYHVGVAYTSAANAAIHCPHANVSGGGVCSLLTPTTGSTSGSTSGGATTGASTKTSTNGSSTLLFTLLSLISMILFL
jgi:hypothetical protein